MVVGPLLATVYGWVGKADTLAKRAGTVAGWFLPTVLYKSSAFLRIIFNDLPRREKWSRTREKTEHAGRR